MTSPSCDLFRDDLDRKLQAERTAEILGNSTLPVVMVSYITNPPGSRDYKRIIQHGKVKVSVWKPFSLTQNLSLSLPSSFKDIDATDRKRWCEYLFYRDLIR